MSSPSETPPDYAKWIDRLQERKVTVDKLPEAVLRYAWASDAQAAFLSADSAGREAMLRAEIGRRSSSSYEHRTRLLTWIAIVLSAVSTIATIYGLYRPH